MKKKLLGVLVCATMIMSLAAGCGSSASQESSDSGSSAEPAASADAPAETGDSEETAQLLTGGSSNIIYCITPSTSNVYFKTVQDICTKYGEELGYEVKCFSHDDDASAQSDLFDQAIADDAAFIVCDNAGADASIEAIQRAADASIPTFLVDREINETGVAAAQIVADNAQGAAAIAEAWVEAMEYEGQYAELLGLESDTNCQVRSENFHSVIDQYEDMEMVAQQSASWDQTEAYEKTESILQANPDIKGIICGNDTMACGAAAACQDAGREDILIIGVDGSDDAAALIKEGRMVGTALQQIAYITQLAVEEGDAYIKGTAPEEEKQLIECIAITSENVDNLSAFVYTE
ncbi:MAG: D-ribose ABC transporter substrate-binding protein [Eubacterium sp.]|nr:D-ribose ABC transporter substrate-binding protein [Eubacterium sp.]